MIESLIPEGAFDPEMTAMLVAAFEGAWEAVKKSGSHLAEVGQAPATRDVLAKHIIQRARAGERDPKKLVSDALAHLATLR